MKKLKATPREVPGENGTKMLRAVEGLEFNSNVPFQYAKSMPVGKSQTAGYCTWGPGRDSQVADREQASPSPAPCASHASGFQTVPHRRILGGPLTPPGDRGASLGSLGHPRLASSTQAMRLHTSHRGDLGGGSHKPAQGRGMVDEKAPSLQGPKSKPTPKTKGERRSCLRKRRFLRHEIRGDSNASASAKKERQFPGEDFKSPTSLFAWLNWLLGFLSKSSLPLGRYVASTTTPSMPSKASLRDANLFPCPPPFPWSTPLSSVRSRRSRRRDLRWQRRRCCELWVNFMTCALSQQALQLGVAPERGKLATL